ncbi:MAG: cupin [Betaproteobacteria bacterium RIFCSPLOWO2_12_FULL_62_58]|nr:MAG: cupin [Betaproteobacteria bacterium RIFCSPLOWO2_12_FULL_62_58]
MTQKILVGLSVRAFLRRHWQKKPLLARRALPHYAKLVTRDALFALAARDDVQSRIVSRTRNRWQVAHGPFSKRELARLPARGWTLLVQGINQMLPAAQALLLEFAFIPYARLDDVMVSYAPPGGGVGPHFDSYDVFLLQLAGTRRWRISSQRDLALIENAPIKVLRDFHPEREWLLAPGDMLYLPPRIAHDGIAIDHCLTASVGFRAPGAQELGARFLEFLQDELALKGIYRDPELQVQHHPARIGGGMLQKVRRMLGQIDWRASDILRFLGQYLTEPKPHVFFTPPARPLTAAAFARRAARLGLQLDLKTQMLFRGRQVFINGERCQVGRAATPLLARLADRRRIAAPLALDAEAAHWLYQWYRAGYIELDTRERVSE